MELVAGQSRLDRTFGRHHRELKSVEEEIKKLMNKFLRNSIDSNQIVQWLEIAYPEHYEHILQPPRWISVIMATYLEGDKNGWQRAGRSGSTELEDNTAYAYWKTAQDLEFLRRREEPPLAFTQQTSSQVADISSHNMFSALDIDTDSSDVSHVLDSEVGESDDDETEEPWQKNWAPVLAQAAPEARDPPLVQIASPPSHPTLPTTCIQISDLRDPLNFFVAHGCDRIPIIPSSDRPLEVLLPLGEIWTLSQPERERLDVYWTEEMRINLHRNQLQDFENLREKHAETLRIYNEGKDEVCFT